VTSGSNGRCTKAVNASTGESSCTSAEEAQSSCAGDLSCLAAPEYDGPTGVGTPKGVTAFTPASSSGAAQAEPVEAPVGPPSSTSGTAEALVPSYPALATTAGGPPPPPRLFALALTRRALAALNRARPRISRVSFAFTLTAASNVKITLAKRVVSHRRA